jgi:hypothetical protein
MFDTLKSHRKGLTLAGAVLTGSAILTACTGGNSIPSTERTQPATSAPANPNTSPMPNTTPESGTTPTNRADFAAFTTSSDSDRPYISVTSKPKLVNSNTDHLPPYLDFGVYDEQFSGEIQAYCVRGSRLLINYFVQNDSNEGITFYLDKRNSQACAADKAGHFAISQQDAPEVIRELHLTAA